MNRILFDCPLLKQPRSLELTRRPFAAPSRTSCSSMLLSGAGIASLLRACSSGRNTVRPSGTNSKAKALDNMLDNGKSGTSSTVQIQNALKSQSRNRLRKQNKGANTAPLFFTLRLRIDTQPQLFRPISPNRIAPLLQHATVYRAP